MLNVKLSKLMDEQNNSTNNNNNSNTIGLPNNSQNLIQEISNDYSNTTTGHDITNGQKIVELIENLVSQIQENDERLRELNNERNAIHRSLRECRQQLDNIMEQYRLEVIVKNGKEYRSKQK